MKKLIIITFVLAALHTVQAQKGKVQTAWRALSDYESTLADGKPDIAFLNKAKEAIDLALNHADTKNQGKTHAYKVRIMYDLYSYALSQEMKKLEATVTDKKERTELAYGTVPTTYLEEAQQQIDKIQAVDPKYLATIQDGFSGKTQLSEDDAKFMLAAAQMKMEISNIAAGKYKAKKYEEAGDYFYKLAELNTTLTNKKDTSNFYNACVSAGRAKIPAKIIEYNTKMVDLKIASLYNFNSLYTTHINNKDTAAAVEILKKGREVFPNDAELLQNETFLFIALGKRDEALANLAAAIEKDPKSAISYLVRANIYDNMANPKDAAGKDKDKPSNFDELFKNAETNYLKVIELNPSNKEHLYNSIYGLGAMYNNYVSYLQNKSNNLALTEVKTKGKEYDAKAQEYGKKAIPHLEQALSMKPDDLPTMMALRKLYYLVSDTPKANDMTNKIKAAGGK